MDSSELLSILAPLASPRRQIDCCADIVGMKKEKGVVRSEVTQTIMKPYTSVESLSHVAALHYRTSLIGQIQVASVIIQCN